MICSSLNRDLYILVVFFVGTNSTSNWRRKRVSGHREKMTEEMHQRPLPSQTTGIAVQVSLAPHSALMATSSYARISLALRRREFSVLFSALWQDTLQTVGLFDQLLANMDRLEPQPDCSHW